jgi:hypothetical protein
MKSLIPLTLLETQDGKWPQLMCGVVAAAELLGSSFF